jgi:ribosomal protein L37AE/L43A
MRAYNQALFLAALDMRQRPSAEPFMTPEMRALQELEQPETAAPPVATEAEPPVSSTSTTSARYTSPMAAPSAPEAAAPQESDLSPWWGTGWGRIVARLASIVFVLAVGAAPIWIVWSIIVESKQEEAKSMAFRARINLGRDCTDWSHHSRVDKYVAGPWEAEKCRVYFAGRASAEVERDATYWREQIEDAQKDWELWQQQHKGETPAIETKENSQ